MEQIVFYAEWLSLPKAEFNILTMLAEQGGAFSGNLSDMCRYFTVTLQQRNRNALRSAIENLTSKGFITSKGQNPQQPRCHRYAGLQYNELFSAGKAWRGEWRKWYIYHRNK